MKNNELKAELERVRLASGGLLHEEAVVQAAADETSVLHDQFTWDDSEAAKQWRLEEARSLIRRVYVSVEAGGPQPVILRMYASLGTDRIAGGGYRSITDILTDDERRAELLKTALAELQALETRYRTLVELAPVFEAAKHVKKKRSKARSKSVKRQPAASPAA